jgi:hypothetical protein
MTIYIKDNQIVELPESFKIKRMVDKTVIFEEAVKYLEDESEPKIIPRHEAIIQKVEEFELPYEELTHWEFISLGYSIAPDQPEYNPVWQTCLWENNAWVVKPSEAAIQRDNAWASTLQHRQQLLNSTDYIVDEYDNMTAEDVQAWKDYRQALRDITQHRTGEIDDWRTVVWPIDPLNSADEVME